MRARWLLALTATIMVAPAAQNQDVPPTYPIPFFPSAADAVREGFARVINHSAAAGTVEIDAFDDEGRHYGPISLSIGAGRTVHFNSGDLEEGRPSAGLDGGTGGGQGDWRLAFSSELDIEVLAYVRTTDGFLTAIHDTVVEVDGRYWAPTFNPGSNTEQVSRLRMSNPGDEPAEVTISGVDDKGESPGGTVEVSVPASATRTFSSAELESGEADGLEGSLGDGAGKWQIFVDSDQPLIAASLLSSPTGHVTNLSTVPGNEDNGVHAVPLFPSAADPDGRQGFVRVINRSDTAGEVTVHAFDDSTWVYEPLTLSIGANETAHFNSDDLELGNTPKGLSGRTGAGVGDWCLELTSELDIVVLAYLRTTDGFLTALHDRVPSAGERHRVAFFNPASNADQKSLLRLVNAGDEAVTVDITGKDGIGASPGSTVRVAVPAGASKTFDASQLESGEGVVEGALGRGEGKWRLSVVAEDPLVVMSLLSSPTGHLTNLSTAPSRGAGVRPDLNVSSMTVTEDAEGTYPGGSLTLAATVTNKGDGPSPATTLRYYRSSNSTISTSDTEVATDGVEELAASANSAESADVTAPDATGTYYYGACVEAVHGEADDTDNCSSSVAVTVLEPPAQPNLEVGAPTANDTTPATGASFTLSATVTNAGDAASAATTLRYYRSTNATISTSDTQVGTAEVGALSASGTSAESIRLTAPDTAGAYHYGACVDSVPDESDTTDNCSSSVKVDVEAPKRPDLEVGAPTANDTTPETGASFTLSATVTNAGDAASAATTLRYYRSTDATISTSDTQVGTDEVGALSASGTSAESITLTAPDTAGAYHYGACVDSVPDESDTADNCSSSVKVDVETPKRPDLEVGAPTANDTTPETGASFTLSATVTNAGDAASAATTLRYYRSTDATISTSDTQAGTDEVGALPASGTSAESIGLTAPDAAGTYYYGACVDSVPDESDTTDNCSSSVKVDVEAPKYPNLVVGAPTVDDATPGTGAAFTLSVTVTNAGDAASPATRLRYYRSTNATITVSDTPAGTDDVDALSASGTSVESISVTAPGRAGAYYYGACVDSVTGESDTTDNCSSSVKVDIQTPAPTASVEVTAPQGWAPVGGTVTYTARVLGSDGNEMTGRTVSWSSSDTGKATVDSSGVVTAVAVGEATITATANASTSSVGANAPPVGQAALASNAGTLSGSLPMQVVEPVARIEFAPSSLSFAEVGAAETVTATLYDANDNEMNATHWGWFSADREVVVANSRYYGSESMLSANVSSIGEGTTSVTLNANGTSTSLTATVTLPTARVDITPRSLSFEALGDTKSVTVRVLDENGDEDEDATFSAFSAFSPCCHPNLADPPKGIAIERVDDGLQITAEGPGRGQVSISSTGVESAILGVRVTMKPSSLEVSPDVASVAVDGTTTLTAKLMDANGNAIHVSQGDGGGGHVVYWETDNDEVATVVGNTASQRGNTGGTATVTGSSVGSATITGRWGGSITGTASITVTDGGG